MHEKQEQIQNNKPKNTMILQGIISGEKSSFIKQFLCSLDPF